MEPSNIQIRVLPDDPELLDSNSYARVSPDDEDVEENKGEATATNQKNLSFGSNAPPNYDEGKESPIPPATSTMYRSVKRSGAAATRSYGLIKRAAAVFCCSITIIVILAILMVVPIAMIVIGSINLKNCALQKMVPIWLIVFGSLSIIKNLSTLIQRIKALKQKDEEQSSRTILNVFDSFMALFLIIWFICGNIWIYGNFSRVQSNDSALDNYCDRLTFYFTFWIITAIYIVIIVSCLLFCCTVCFTIFLPPRK